MKSLPYFIISSLVLTSCGSTSHDLWREIGSAEFEKVAATEQLHGCIGENAFMLKGFTLGEESMRVEFTHVRWSKQSDSVIVSGKVVNAISADPLANVTVAFGRIDTLADAGRINPVTQTVTDIMGQFYLASRMVPNGKLAFTLLGYLAKVYNIDKFLD